MTMALYTAKTGLDAQDRRLQTQSNNIANVNTVGFKRDASAFQSLPYINLGQPGADIDQGVLSPAGLLIGTGVELAANIKQHTQGSTVTTGQDLDMMVSGNGFFQVTLPDGTIAYSRDGQFSQNQDGDVVNSSGYVLEPAINIPTNATSITVSTAGVVTIGLADGSTQNAGTITLARFVNNAGLQALGGNLFQETQASGAPQVGTAGQDGYGTIVQGALEGANVNIVEEMVGLIETQRAYEMNSKSIDAADQSIQSVLQVV